MSDATKRGMQNWVVCFCCPWARASHLSAAPTKYVCKSNNPYLISAPRRVYVYVRCHFAIHLLPPLHSTRASMFSSGCIAEYQISSYAVARETTRDNIFTSRSARYFFVARSLHRRRSAVHLIECKLLARRHTLQKYHVKSVVFNFCSKRVQIKKKLFEKYIWLKKGILIRLTIRDFRETRDIPQKNPI